MMSKTGLTLAWAGVIAIVAFLALPPSAAAKPHVELVSRAPSGEKANAGSYDPVVSRDGRYVAFESDASNLHPDDTDGIYDVFVRDMETGAIQLVSRATGPSGQKADDLSGDPSISPDGRFVAFASEAENLVPGLPSNSAQVYVRDLQTGTTTLASRGSGPLGAVGEYFSSDPSISADGRFVAFQSSSNLAPEDSSGDDIYVRDLVTQTTILASRASGPAGAKGNDVSFHPSLAADGSRVAFTSYASNIDPDDNPPNAAIYVRDLMSNETTLESRGSGRPGKAGNSESGGAEVSGDGSRVVFSSSSTNLAPGPLSPFNDLYVRDLNSKKTTILSRDPPAPRRLEPSGVSFSSISANGNRVAFSYGFRRKGRRAPLRDRVFIANLRTDELDRVPGIVGANETIRGEVGVSLSANGRWLTFEAQSRLHPDDHDSAPDTYLTRLRP